MTLRQSPIRDLTIIAVMMVLLGACGGGFEFSTSGGTPSAAATELIQGDLLAQRLGIEQMTAAICAEPDDIAAGAVFTCKADSGGETVNFLVTIDGPDQVSASPTNVIDRSLLADYAANAVDIVNNKIGLSLPADVIDCGTRSVVLDHNQQMICAVTDPDTGDTFDAQLTITDQERAAFTVKILIGE